MSSKYDVIIYGATGFTGRLASLYVAKQYGSSIRWAIAGRSKQKLEVIKAECQAIDGKCDIIIADSDDDAALAAMAAQTKVVCTFAGPFSRYGSKLVAACVAAGVGYCDITGEIDWVREMVAKHDDAAKASGARIVHLTGHDSLPWDIMTFMLAKKLKEGNVSAELKRVEFWDSIKSKPSGGTLETAVGIMFGNDGKKKASEVKALGYDPLLKRHDASGASEFKVSAKNVGFFEGSNPKKGHSSVRTLFFMAGVNANAVKRSNALNGYGKNVTYSEGQAFKSNVSAFKYLAGLVLFGICFYIPPLRFLLRKFVLPKPGEGPSEEFMKSGYLNITGVATSTDDRMAKATIRFPVDPGYLDTARMCIESGLALSFDEAHLHSKTGGVMTPGACQGEAVLNRLLKTGSAFEYH
jgi:short subunit dehydrogenase-like uncharacterized protein